MSACASPTSAWPRAERLGRRYGRVGVRVRIGDPANPVDAYTRIKAAAVMPSYVGLGTVLGMIRIIYDMPLAARCEIVYDADAASTLVSAVENLRGAGEMRGRTGFIAGGAANGCQIRIQAMLEGAFGSMGLAMPREELFPDNLGSYYLDWYDTAEVQSILGYQNHTFDQWNEVFTANFRFLKPAVAALRPVLTAAIARLSPRFTPARSRRSGLRPPRARPGRPLDSRRGATRTEAGPAGARPNAGSIVDLAP
ncbi:MAG TPA: hypothetical protein PK179_00040 [Spirochaetales bacterium]|nr:hypothetical protein [Spirochaetales bacterium]